MRPCDAINALYRGHALIVAGDQKQLPPTSFFEQTTDAGDEWVEEAPAEFESVLDLAKGAGAFRSLSLRWHYRTPPRAPDRVLQPPLLRRRPRHLPQPDPAGRRPRRRAHPASTASTAAAARATTRSRPTPSPSASSRTPSAGERSIGVVAFSEAQASLIEEVLRRDPRRDDERFEDLFGGDRLASLFVKNLENVQGDERDVIIFSVGYGPDEHGKLTMNFGPLNREGGWRRLNVAITRARRRVEVVCSFAPEQLGEHQHRRRRAAPLPRVRRARAPPRCRSTTARASPRARSRRPCCARCAAWATASPRRSGRPATGSTSRSATPSSRAATRSASSATARCTTPRASPATATACASRCSPASAGRCTASGARAGTATAPARSDGCRRRSSARCCSTPRPAVAPRPPTPVAVDFEDVVLDAPPPWAEPYRAATLPAGPRRGHLARAGGERDPPARDDDRHRGGADRRGPADPPRDRRVGRRAEREAALDHPPPHRVAGLLRRARAPRQRVSAAEPVDRPRARARRRGSAHAARGQARARTSSSPRRWRGWSATRGSSPRRRPSSAPRGSSAGRATARRSRRRWRASSRTSRTTGASSATPTGTCTRSV